jgi:hypothetical protein
MIRVGFPLVSLVLFAGLARAAIGTDKFIIFCGGKCLFDTADGIVRLQNRTLTLENGGDPAYGRWYILATQIKSSMGKGYLAYDLTGKDARLFLAAKPGENTEWSITLMRDPREKEGQLATIRVANGPMKGWSICLESSAGAGGARAVLAPKGKRLTAERIVWHR